MKFLIVLILFATKSCLVESTDSHEQSYELTHLKFVRKNHGDYKDLTKNTKFSKICSSKYFNRSLPSVLIIHGIETDYKSEYAKTLVAAFVSRNEHNVIFGDWSSYAFDEYLDMAHEVEHIADVFVDLMNKVRAEGYDLTNVHIIGHNLGAHIAGRIGRVLQYQKVMLPRITGLDPSGSHFDRPRCWLKRWFEFVKSNHKPLSRDDANFVDIIHSNAGIYRGTVHSTGHLDFWPNCGVFQPHCDECRYPNIILDWKECSRCSHVASWRYYAESVYSSTPIFRSTRCDTKFLMKLFCNGAHAYMGYYASNTSENGNYYVETNVNSPYSK